MAKDERDYDVIVEAEGSPPTSTPKLGKKGVVLDPGYKLVFDKGPNGAKLRKSDHHRIKFEIKDFNSQDLKFIQDEDNVMWVQSGNQCPRSPCSMPSVFWVDWIHPQGKSIEVINMNIVKENFAFTLNLVKKSVQTPTSSDYVPLDPGGTNQNNGGPGSGFTTSAFLAIALGAASGLVTFFGTKLFLTE